MKKKLLFATIILVLLAGILYYISLPDYLVFNSMSFSNGANRDTELQVIVYQYWNTDEVIAEIEAEHNQINGRASITSLLCIFRISYISPPQILICLFLLF